MLPICYRPELHWKIAPRPADCMYRANQVRFGAESPETAAFYC